MHCKKVMMVLCSFLILFSGSSSVFALEEDAPKIQINPASFTVKLNPGETAQGVFSVQNVGKTPFHYELDVAPYQPANESYTADLETENSFTQIKEWILFDRLEGELEPNQSDVIHFAIPVPEDPPAGGQYAVVLAKTKNNQEKSNTINVTSQVGMIVFGEIDGETRKEGRVLTHSAESFYIDRPLGTSLLMENTGNTHYETIVSDKIYNTLTGEEIYSNEDKPRIFSVLPGTKRAIAWQWDESPQLGIFTVEETVKFLERDELLSKIVVLCPSWLIMATILFIAGVIGLIFYRRAKRRKSSLKEAKDSYNL